MEAAEKGSVDGEPVQGVRGREAKYDLEERLLNYSVRIIRLTEALPRSLAGNHIAKQLLRSGTSPYPNHGEAQASESAKDFIHKLRIALKELRETQRWLKLVCRAELVKPAKRLDDILKETDELIRIFLTSIRTAQQRHLTKKPPQEKL